MDLSIEPPLYNFNDQSLPTTEKSLLNVSDNPFESFWMGGFECTDQLNNTGNRVDLLTETRHLACLDDDYKRLRDFGILTVREGIRWSKVEKQPGVFDFSTVKIMLDAGIRNGVQQVWDICHFGFPDDISPLHPHFSKRFVAVCAAFVEFHKLNYPGRVLIVTPINEVNFLSWLGGEVASTSPYCRNNGWEVKYHLMKAYINGIKAMKIVDPNVRILTTEPLVNIVATTDATPEQVNEAANAHLEQFQALDILCGKMCPELGGSPDLLDLLGFNYYFNNQWLATFESCLCWKNEDLDPRWRPLHELLAEAYNRYKRPFLITETSHPLEDRPRWIRFISEQCATVISLGLPLFGICLYPIIDRPDWDDLNNWHKSGLWDEVLQEDGNFKRVLYEPYAHALREAQEDIVTARSSYCKKETEIN